MTGAEYTATKEAARANRAFYAAFESFDLERMRGVWSASPDVQCIHPGGEALVGPELVMASWAAIFDATDSIRFDLVDLSVHVVGDLAWVSNVERIDAVADSEPYRSLAAATNLYVREGGGWRLLLHHASPIARRFFGPEEAPLA